LNDSFKVYWALRKYSINDEKRGKAEMVDRNVTFIVGAGASYEAGLPTGEELKADIAARLDMKFGYDGSIEGGDQLLAATLLHIARHTQSTPFEATIEMDGLRDASQHICEAMPGAISIDNFVNSHKGNSLIELVSKMAIARAVLESEKNSRLAIANDQKTNSNPPRLKLDKLNSRSDRTPCGTWYNNFFKLFNDCQIEDLEKRFNSISIIIFNYDRCVEQYLYQALQVYYRIPPSDAAELVNKIEIFHPYGTVGKLPWMKEADSGLTFEFGYEPNSSELIKVAKCIRTFSESTSEVESEIKRIRCAANDNRMLVFLGFGFLDLNIELLDLDPSAIRKVSNINDIKKALCTGIGLSEPNSSIIKNVVAHRLRISPQNITIDRESGCANFLTKYNRDISQAISQP
jgi:hypothetical protein